MGVSKVILENDVLMDITDTTAVENRIFYPYTAYGADGDQMVGTYSGGSIQRYNITVVENQDGTQTLNITDAVDGAYFIVFDILEDGTQRLYISDAGSGGSSEPNLQSKTVSYTPSETAQSETVTADSGYDGLSSVAVSVGAISSTYVGSGISRKSSTDLTASGATVTAPAGYYSEVASKAVASGSLVQAITTTTIVPTITVNSSGLVAASGNGFEIVNPVYASGWIDSSEGQAVYTSADGTYQLDTQAATTITPSTSSQTAVAAGKYTTGAVTVAAMPSGSATAPSTISGTAATVSTGTNTLTLSKSVSVAPVVSAGYVASGTAGNATVSLTANVTTKAAATITPGTTNQTIAAGTYLTGTQTIAGDADLVGGNILSTANIFGVQGTVVIQHYYTGSSAPSSSLGSDGDIYLQT